MVETEETAESAARVDAKELEADAEAKKLLYDAVKEEAIDALELALLAEALVNTLMLEPILCPVTYKSP